MRAAAALLIGTILVLNCAKGERAVEVRRARAIIVISVDTLRSDRLPAYGYTKIATPHIDAFRRDAILFSHAYSHIPLTLPSHATIFTGLLPADNGVRDNSGFKLAPESETIASLLKESGYATGAAVSAYSMRSSSGIDRGFDVWDDHFVPRSLTDVAGEVQRPGAETIAIAKQWIAANREKPLFYFLHLYEPHTPYSPPEPYRSLYPIPYDGEIAHTDALLGDFVAFLREQKIYDDAAIIFLSDHGEGLNDHGEDEHGILLYREAIQVPLIVKLPRAESAGKTIDTPAQLTDVFAAIRALASGESIPLLAAGPDRPIFSETYFPRLRLGWSEQHSLIRGSKHLIDGPKTELYDLRADPAERNDLAASDRRSRSAMLEEIAPLAKAADPTVAIDPEEARKLAALGYIGSASPASGGPLPDPKVEISKFREVKQALWFRQNGRHAEAVAATDKLLASNSRMFDVWDIRARSLMELGRTEEALTAAKRAAALSPADPSIMLLIASLALRRGMHDDAAQHARLAVASRPAEAHEMLARIALDRGDLATAETEGALAESTAPESAAVAWMKGRIALARQQLPVALTHFDRAIALAAKSQPIPELHGDRGFVLAVQGRTREAEAAFKEELRLFPSGKTARENLILLYRQQGRSREAAALK